MALLVVRHAHAGHRDQWDGPDDVRPLTPRGLVQAEGLVARLREFTVGRILSSPYLRCTQTVEPLAAACGLAVEPTDDMAEGAGAAAWARVLGLTAAGDGQSDVALCTHGDVVLEILTALASSGVDLPADLPMRKGSTWALSVQGARVVGARYLDPPSGT